MTFHEAPAARRVATRNPTAERWPAPSYSTSMGKRKPLTRSAGSSGRPKVSTRPRPWTRCSTSESPRARRSTRPPTAVLACSSSSPRRKRCAYPTRPPSRRPRQQKGPGSQAPFALAAFFFAQVAWNFFRRAALHLGRATPSARSTAAGRTLSFRSFEISPCRSLISASMA
jgi:hypothetical protein